MKLHRFLAAVAAFAISLSALPLLAQNNLRQPPVGGGGNPGATLPPVRTAPPTTSAPAPSGTNVAVIDLQEVFDRHVRFKQAMDNINKDAEQLNAKLRLDQKELQKMVEHLKDLKPGTPDYKSHEEQAAQFESNLRVQAQLERKNVAERQAKATYQTYEEVIGAVQSFAEQNRIALVIQFSADEIDPANPQSIMRGLNRGVVYQKELNITKYVIQMVNRGTPEPRPNNDTVRKPTIPGRRVE